MTIYLLTYIFYFTIVGIGLVRKNTKKWIVAATIPMFALMWLRGNVGVDLPMYVLCIELIQKNNAYSFIFEPSFEFLILVLSHINSDPSIVAKLIASLTTLFLFVSKWNTKTAYQVLSLGIIPYFYLDMTMNGLRYGLAFSIALMSLNSLLKLHRVRYTSLTFLSVSIQISTLYFAGLLNTLLKQNKKHILLLLTIFVAVATLGTDYVNMKVAVNLELTKPDVSSGLAPLVLSSIALAGCWKSNIFKNNFRTTLFSLSALTLATYTVTQLSYAGLRLQQLNLFLILLFIVLACEKTKIYKSRALLISLVAVAILGTASRLHNFYSDMDKGEAPFSPYKFYWQK